MSMLAERMGNTKLRQALSLFDFGQRSGIELPGEHAVKETAALVLAGGRVLAGRR